MMNATYMTIGVTLILLILGLSGCIENQDVDTFELVSYTVESYEVCILDAATNKQDFKLGDGFIHPDELGAYEINGIIKNKSNKNESVNITVSFYDVNNTFLESSSFTFKNIPGSSEHPFKICFDWNELDYFEKVENVTFNLKNV